MRGGWRLACRQRITRDVTVIVPESSVFGGRHQILTDHDTGAAQDLEPEVRQARVRNHCRHDFSWGMEKYWRVGD